jgi:hypothetical protein
VSAFVTALVHEWHERGDAVTIDALAGGGLKVTVSTENGRGVIELDARAAEALLHALDSWDDEHQVGPWHQRIAELTERLDRLEAVLEEWERPGDARQARNRIARSTAARVIREALA